MLRFKQFQRLTEELNRISSQMGSNPGGVYRDSETSEEHYIKHPYDTEHAKTEVLSSRIHELMGLKTLNPKLISMKAGTNSISTVMNKDMELVNKSHMNNFTDEHHKDIGTLYAAGVLTKNWDALGSGIEYGQGNLGIDKKKGNLISFDHGGSFNYRAMGGKKDYNIDIGEKDTLKDESISEGAKIFNNSLNRPFVKKHVHQVLRNLDLKKVKGLFKDSGLNNWEELHSNFKERHKQLLKHYETENAKI